MLRNFLQKFLISGLVFILFVFLFGTQTFAQVLDSDIVFRINPENPAPGELVSVSVQSYSLDLNKTNITWFLDGGEMSRGIGKKTFSFKMEKNEVQKELSVNIDTIDGQNITKSAVITTGGVDLLWEAYDSYVPPFYKGKKMTPSQGKFKVVAIPSIPSDGGGRVRPENLSYAWSLDGNPLVDRSGWGKNFFIFQNSYLDEVNEASVKISSISGGVSGSKKIFLKTETPKILFYLKDPVFGIRLEKSFSQNLQMDEKGSAIVAEPYFFSPQDLNSPRLSMDWFINSQKIIPTAEKNILYLRPEKDQKGTASLRVKVENTATLFQIAEKGINIEIQ